MHDIDDDLVSLVGFKPDIPIKSISPMKDIETKKLNFCVCKKLAASKNKYLPDLFSENIIDITDETVQIQTKDLSKADVLLIKGHFSFNWNASFSTYRTERRNGNKYIFMVCHHGYKVTGVTRFQSRLVI